jgi:transcriptional regulator with XRE-family HTH domain
MRRPNCLSAANERRLSMLNIVTGRQLRAARILAGLTQKELAEAVGVHERAARYWELKEDEAPTSTVDLLAKTEECCAIKESLFSRSQLPACVSPGIAGERVIRTENAADLTVHPNRNEPDVREIRDARANNPRAPGNRLYRRARISSCRSAGPSPRC